MMMMMMLMMKADTPSGDSEQNMLKHSATADLH